LSEFLEDLCGDVGLTLARERRGFLHFYDHHFQIFGRDGKRCGFAAFGGESQKSTVNVQLTGAACAHVEAWAHVALRLSHYSARLTRVDVAFDDLRGLHDLCEVERMYEGGKFSAHGRPPALQRQGWEDGSGRSIYVGKDRAHQQLCVYEKGREQGARDDSDLSKWVRWEARFGAAYRVIPVDILTRPADFMRGQYEALYFVRGDGERIATDRGSAESNFVSALRHSKQQCGRFLLSVRSVLDDDADFLDFVNRELVGSKLPDWFAFNPAASPVVRECVT
jgi:DNA relaxase NicK